MRFLDEFRPGATAEVRKRLAPELLESIDSALPSSWVPIETDAAMGRAVLALLGPDEARRFWTRFTTHHVESPLLAGPVRAALRVLGATPGSLIKWMPRVFPTVFRDVFEIEVMQLEPSAARIAFRVQSDVFWDEPVYALVLESTVRGFYEITKARGDVAVSRDTERRILNVQARWGA